MTPGRSSGASISRMYCRKMSPFIAASNTKGATMPSAHNLTTKVLVPVPVRDGGDSLGAART
jgi:hypothetical protein